MRKKLLILSIIINLILIVLEIFILLQSFIQWMPEEDKRIYWYQALTYYTEDSNISLFIGSMFSLLGSIFLLRGKDSMWYHVFKYLGVTTTMVTFTTVYIFMAFYQEPSLGFSIHGNLWLLSHTICPLLGISSYFIFDEDKNVSIKMVFIPILFTICYTIMILIVYASGGRIPYISDFDNDFKISAGFIVLLGIIETLLTIILGFLIRFLKNKMNERRLE